MTFKVGSSSAVIRSNSYENCYSVQCVRFFSSLTFRNPNGKRNWWYFYSTQLIIVCSENGALADKKYPARSSRKIGVLMKDNRKIGAILKKVGVTLMLSAAVAGILGIVKPGHEKPTSSTKIVKPGHRL